MTGDHALPQLVGMTRACILPLLLLACEGSLSAPAGFDAVVDTAAVPDGSASDAPHLRDASGIPDVWSPGLDGGDHGAPADAAGWMFEVGRPRLDLGPPAPPDAAPPAPPEPDAASPPPEEPCAIRPYERPPGCPFEVEVVVWTVGGWNILADAFAANPAPCAHYYLSVPPLVGDRTTLRRGEAARIRAHGPQFHALAEFADGAWSDWREANGTTWVAAAGEFRRRAADAGYCLGRGDGWIVNEMHSSARSDPAARGRWVNLVRALHEGGEGAADDAPGAIAVIGMGHGTQNLGVYKSNLRGWLQDRAFWEGVAPHVRWWAQESYCDTRYTCVGGDLDLRARHINRYAMHVGRLSVVAPDGAGVNTAQSYLSRAFVPMLNSVWGSSPQNGYGDTDVPLDTMKMFVTEQIYANRRYANGNAHPDGRVAFALQSYRNPREYAAIGERMAQAIANGYAPGAEAIDACRGNGGARGWCRCAVPGARFNEAWETFQSW